MASRREPLTAEVAVVGGGPAGLTAAITAAKAGHAVAMVERNLTGGTCVNFGCTPSKSLLRAARAVYQARDGQKFGYALQADLRVDFAAVMTRVRQMRAFSGSFDAVSVAAGAGIDVFLGDGRFAGPDAVAVAGQTLRFRKALIATGGRPQHLPVPGLAEAGFLTNETVFTLTALPPRVAVVGAGPVGFFCAQAARLDTHTVLAIDLDPARLAIAERDGSIAIDASARNAQTAVFEHTDGRGADVVIEAVGTPAAFERSLDVVRRGGAVVVMGVYTSELVQAQIGVWWIRALQLRFAGTTPIHAWWEKAMAEVVAGRLDPTPIVSHRLSLEEAPKGYELFDTRQATKVLLKP